MPASPANPHFDKAFDEIIKVEGGYVNDPADRGGETMYGITVKVARAAGYNGAMRDLPLDVAKQIYKTNYWDSLKLDDIAKKSPPVAHECFESAVNCGIMAAAKWLQTAINALSKTATLTVDGKVGAATVAALEQRDAAHVVKLLNIQQGYHYLNLSVKSPSQKKFLRGWLKRVSL